MFIQLWYWLIVNSIKLIKITATSKVKAVVVHSIEEVAGDWWVVRGINCGQDDVWRGGYDW